MAAIRLVRGPERSGRSAFLDAQLVARPITTALLVPTRTLAKTRLERILQTNNLPGLWGNPVLSLEDFAKRIVEGEGTLVIEIDELERRLLLEEVVSRLRAQGRLDALGDASDSTGFINHALFVISQLKQAAVEPHQFRAAIPERKRPSWLDSIVADVYESYQDALLQSGKYDRVGIYWRASLIAANARPKGLAQFDSLILDGFDDFTPSEFRLIQNLAPHLGEITFGMVSSNVPTQHDLYALPLETERRIQKEFDVAEVQTFPEEAPKTFVHLAAAQLFARDAFPVPGELTPNVEILSCGDLTHEIETIGRRIKSLLLDGAAPDSIAVAYRSAREAAPILRALFREFGIPASYSESVALAESSIARYLLSLFEAAEKWHRDAVVDVMTSPWFAPQDNEAQVPIGAATLARAAGIIEGRSDWMERIDALSLRLADRENDWEESLKRKVPNVNDALTELKTRVKAFTQLADTLPPKAQPLTFLEACRGILERDTVERALACITVESIRAFETAARNALRTLLNRMEVCCEKTDPSNALSRNDFLKMLRREMAALPVPEVTPTVAVRCVDFESLRRSHYDYVFLAGINEGECPQPPAIRVIYGEEDVQDWKSAGVELDSKRKWSEREMLLFQQGMCSAQKHLCITWRTLSSNGRPLSPSPFIADICEVFPGIALCHSSDAGSGFVPALDEVASWRDLRNAAFLNGDETVKPFASACTAAIVGRDIERRRQNYARFDEYDGVLSSEEANAILKDRFGDAHVFSVRQIESYAECPFQFFLTHVLRVDAEPEPAAELDPAIRGLLMHRVLEAFHVRYRGRAVADIPPQEACESMQGFVSEVFRSGLVWKSGAPRGTIEAERRALACKLNRYLALARNDEESEWKPTYFEVSFGPLRGASDEPPNKSNAFILNTPAGPVKFSGRIDRIDFSGETARIIDYKTSVHVQSKHIRDGVALQMSVYALALEEHILPSATCEQAILVAVGRKERREALARAKGEWESRATKAIDRVGSSVQGIRAGVFAPVPYERVCNVCSACRVCRHEAARIERKLESEP